MSWLSRWFKRWLDSSELPVLDPDNLSGGPT